MRGTTAPQAPGDGARPTGRSRSCSRRPIRTRCTTRISICSRRRTARRRGRRSVRDLTRPDPGVPSTLDAAAAARHGSQRQARRHLHDRAVAAARADALDRHRRRPDPASRRTTARRWQNVTPPAMTRVEPRDDDRGVALRRQHRVRERRPASAAGLRAVHLSHARHGQDVAEDHERACPPACTCTW